MKLPECKHEFRWGNDDLTDVEWCRKCGIQKLFIEGFKAGYKEAFLILSSNIKGMFNNWFNLHEISNKRPYPYCETHQCYYMVCIALEEERERLLKLIEQLDVNAEKRN